MGQPITVVEKPSPRPGFVRFEANRSFTGMGHERYGSVDDVLADRPVDQLARRLFATGEVAALHVASNVVTVQLAEGTTGDRLGDVIRGLYIYYPQAQSGAEGAADGDADRARSGPGGDDETGAQDGNDTPNATPAP